jgi:hypothetical protein
MRGTGCRAHAYYYLRGRREKNIFTTRMTIPSPRSLGIMRATGAKKRQTPEHEGQQPRTGTYRVLVEGRDWRSGFISRGDVADFLVRQVSDASLIHKTPVLTG